MSGVCVLTDGKRCWKIQITYDFLLDWLDSIIVWVEVEGRHRRNIWLLSFAK